MSSREYHREYAKTYNKTEKFKSYQRTYVKKKRSERKAKAIELKGGKCAQCGYDRCSYALEFHHLSHDTKDKDISQFFIRNTWEGVLKELEKCILLCANCHRELHYTSGGWK
jgi:5-methylcytosine-specific restriction endonuclease McrA